MLGGGKSLLLCLQAAAIFLGLSCENSVHYPTGGSEITEKYASCGVKNAGGVPREDSLGHRKLKVTSREREV